MQTRRILVANAKGGCGKTTIATNLASYYAASGKVVRLFDYDTQGSSLQWLKRRDQPGSKIEGVDASKRPDNHMTRSWQMRVPPETQVVIIDTPAGIEAPELAAMLSEHDFLIIPVLPSPIDIHSTAHFIKDVLLIGKARKRQIRVAVIANRVRHNTLMYSQLERFLFSLNIPFVTSLRDTQFYVKAIADGLGVQEIKHHQTRKDRAQWAPLINWLDTPIETPSAEVRQLFSHSNTP
jgi:chromosome partitioning protein